METIFINDTAYVIGTAVAEKVISSSGGDISVGGDATGEGTLADPTMNIGAAGKDSLLSSWPFVIGISVAVLVVSIALGTFLAKRKIKKGIDLYED